MRKRKLYETAALVLLCGLFFFGCKEEKPDPKAEAPAPVKVEHEQDVNVVQVDFGLAALHDVDVIGIEPQRKIGLGGANREAVDKLRSAA